MSEPPGKAGHPEGRARRGMPLRALAPNAVTALALCFGLTGVRFAIAADWDRALLAIVAAGVLDAMDGRIARMLNGQSRFGAELDSVSDVIAFGVSPAIVAYLWSLQALPRFGWLFALAYAVCAALRLARFNAQIDVQDQPHKSAGFLTGIPAPAGAGLLFLPIYIWLWSGAEAFRHPAFIALWTALVAFLMISNLATYSWGSLRPRQSQRIPALLFFGLIGAGLLLEPWITLTFCASLYALLIPFAIRSYARIKRRRQSGSGAAAAQTAEPA